MNSGSHASVEKPGLIRRFISFVIMIAIVLVASWGLRTYVIEPFQVPSSSMEPTIQGHEASPGVSEVKDMVFAEKLSYRFGTPQRGDIVTFYDPETPSRVLIKRVIATGGQTVNLVKDYTDASGNEHYVVYVDGVKLDEPYVARGEDGKIASSSPLMSANGADISYPYTVPDDCIWVMGDNRENSADSRYFGAVKTSSVFGRAIAIYWPLQDIGLL